MDVAPAYSHQTLPSFRTMPHNTPHLVRIGIQNLVLGGGEWGPAGREGRTVRRPGGARGAAGDVPPGSCARLALALILLSPVESHRPPPTASGFSIQKKDVYPTQDHKPPDHIRQ